MKKNILSISMLILSLCLMSACNNKNTNNQKAIINSIDDLQGKKIGAQLMTTGHLFAEDKYKDDKETQVKGFSKTTDAVAALKQGILDCVIVDEQTANIFVSQNDDLKLLNEPFEKEQYAICTSKDNTSLLNDINNALEELKKDGTFKKIIDNYIGENAGNSPYIKDENNNYENGKLIMATNAQFPPYEFYENDNIVGIDAQMAQAIADKLHKELVIEDMEFDTIIMSVQQKKADIGMAAISITKEREDSVSFSNPYVDTKQVIIVKK